MATKFGMVGIYNEASFNKVTRPFYHAILQGHLKKEICYIPTTVRPMTTKPGKVEVYNEERPSISHETLKGHVKSYVCYTSTSTRPMATKLGNVVTFYEGPPPINLHNHLNSCSCEVTW